MTHHADRHHAPDDEAQTCWDEFWAPLVVKDGVVDMEQVKKELHDYHGMLEQVPQVYVHVTGGVVSKPQTLAREVIQLADEQIEKAIYEARVEWEELS